MWHRHLRAFSSCLLLILWLMAIRAEAGERLPFPEKSHRRAPSNWVDNPEHFVVPAARPHGLTVYHVAGPYYGRGFGVPSFNWGHFGARHGSRFGSHVNYYGTFTQWSFSRGN